MAMRTPIRAAAPAIVSALAFACGGPTATPTATATATPTAISNATANANANATATATATPTPAEPDAGSGGDAGAPAVADSSEWLDKCQANGKEYERKTHEAVKQCHADGSKKGYLKGSVKIAFKIDWDGKKKDVRLSEKSDLPKPVVDCMMKVVKDSSFGDPEACKGKDLTIILKFPPTH
jgi:hypothetical protein